MKKAQLISLIYFVMCLTVYGQVPAIQWQEAIGGSGSDSANAMQQTIDGGYIVLGGSNSTDGDLAQISYNHSDANWLVKLTNTGVISWQTFFGSSYYGANSIKQTTDGGYVAIGYSLSNSSDLTGNHGVYDFWIVKFNSTGIIQWQKSYGGTLDEQASAIQQTNDGGYIIAGYTRSDDGDVTGKVSYWQDYWVVKVNSIGTIQWQKTFGGSGEDYATSIQQTTDGGYIISGSSYEDITYDGVGSPGHHLSNDYWVVKITSAGIVQWKKFLGGSGYDESAEVKQTIDGGYIVAGYSDSNDGNVSGNHGIFDFWVVKLSSSGNIQWQKSLGGTGYDQPSSIQQTTDGGYVVSGFSEYQGSVDYWILKLNTSGNIVWQKHLGGTGDEYSKSMQQTTDGGYILAGYTSSNNGDISGNHGQDDCWIVKLNSSSLSVSEFIDEQIKIYPNPTNESVTIDFNQSMIIGWTVKVSNTLGQEIYRAPIQSQQTILPLSALNGKGVFLVSLYDISNKLIDTKKIILK